MCLSHGEEANHIDEIFLAEKLDFYDRFSTIPKREHDRYDHLPCQTLVKPFEIWFLVINGMCSPYRKEAMYVGE